MEWPFRGRQRELGRAVRLVSGRPARGVVVAGPAYVGRTRFLAELARAVERDRPVHRVRATRSGRGQAFGALGALGPEHVERPATWLGELVDRLGGRGAVLSIDDAQWLDTATAQLLVEAVREEAVAPLLTVRSGHRTPHAVTALWKEDLLERIDLGPLTRLASDEIVTAALDGPVASATLQDLWDLAQGYPVVLREFVTGAVASGTLAREDGLWLTTAPLRPPTRYVELVRDLLRDLPPGVTEAVHLVALGEPLEAELLDQLSTVEVIAAIERSGVVTLDDASRRYRITAPGACMAIRAALEPSVMRALSRRLSSTMLDTDLHEDDLVRFAIWRLDAGDTTDNSLFVRAAERTASTFDHHLTERLARAALTGGGVEARILLANALIHLHRHEEAEQHLVEAARTAETDVHRVRAAGTRSRLLFFRLGRMTEAIQVLERACDEIEDEDLRDQLRGSLALLVSMQGNLDEAVTLCDAVLSRPDATPSSRAIASTSAAFARMMQGRIGDALRCCEDGLALPSVEIQRQFPLARPMLELIAMMAHTHAGRFAEAERRARARYHEALASGADEVSGVWATQLAGLMLYRGDLRESLRLSAEARRLLSVADTLGVHSLAYALAATALAETGAVADAERMLDGLVEVRALHDLRSQLLEERARAVVLAGAGELESAAGAIRAAADRALDHDHRTWAVFTAHHAVRFGYPEHVVDLLERVGRGGEGRLLPAMALHARALADRDVDALSEVGRRFADLGALLWGTEAYAQASRVAADAGLRPRSSLLRARAASLLPRCPGAATPALRGLRVAPLTRREHEIALLATRGLTSRQIAERLVVSTRTVDNHLASVYRKLDVSGRDELPEALAIDHLGHR